MARRPLVFGFTLHTEEDTRATGGLHFADPSMHGYQSHTYNEPTSNAHGEGAVRSNFGSPAPWAVTHAGNQQLHDMNRKRGVSVSDGD